MGLTLEQILNTKDGMTAIRDNEKNVTRPDIVAGSEWLEFYGTEVKTLSIDGNTGISFNDTGIKDMRICGLYGTAVFGVYRQEAELWNGTRFLKIRVEMYNDWFSTDEKYRVIYELFFYDNGIIFVNIPKTPDSASLIGESHIRKPDGTLVALTVANQAKPENPAYITIKNPFSESQEIRYEKYDPYQATGILISELPLKTEYYRYAETDFEGLEVKWTDETGYIRVCRNYTMSECSTEEPGTQIITVTAGEFTAEFEITVLETAVTGIRVTPPIKTEYVSKEEIDFTGIKVEYILSNGQFEETKKYQVSDFDNEFIGTQSLTVTCGKFSDSFDVTIKNIMEFRMGSPNPEDVIAEFDLETGMLTISGIGATTRPPQFGVIHGLIKTVVVEHGVTEIGEYMFSNDEAITSVSLSDTLIKIGDRAFYWCRGLTDIQIPNSVSEICYRAFGDCTGLLTVSIPSGVSIDDEAFTLCHGLTRITIPDGVKKLGDRAFAYCSSLEDVNFEGWPEQTGRSCFAYGNMQSVVIPDGAVRINSDMFYGQGTYTNYDNIVLKNIVLPDTVEYIETSAFGCNIIENITLPSGLKDLSGFSTSKALKTIRIPETVTRILGYCFSNCEVLEEIQIPNSVTEMDKDTFNRCTNLREIRVDKIKDSLPGEPWGAPNATVIWLRDVSELEIVSFPDKMTYYIGDSLDVSGLVIKAIRYNGTSELIEGYECDVDTISFTESGEKAVRLTYEGVSTEFTVTVLADYTVRFVDWNGAVLSVQTVHQGLSAEAPSPSGREGYAFTGWDKGFSNVQSDLTITAQYRILVYTVTFIGMNGDILEEQRVEHGQSASAPSAPSVSGYEFTGWDTEYADIRSNLTVTAQYKMLPSVGIRISSYPDKIYYKIGEKLDTAGLKIVAITSNGTERPVFEYECNGFDSSTTGRKEITVVYQEELSDELSQAFFAEFPVKVTKDGENPFEKGEKFEIRVHWKHGEFKDLTHDDIEEGSLELQEGICSERYFIFGGCISNQISFTTFSKQFLQTDEKHTPQGDIEVYIETEKIKEKIFEGTIDSGKRNSDLISREIIAYDKLYQYRNTDISRWYKNQTSDKNMVLTQKQFRDALFAYLKIEQVPTKLVYDDAHVPTNANNEMNVAAILKDLCLQNSVFGWMNRNGQFEYLKLKENSRLASEDLNGKEEYGYYTEMLHYDQYREIKITEGRIWYPRDFCTLPEPNYGFTDGEPSSAQEAYEHNTYYNRNSFFVGDVDWLDAAWAVNEYGIATVKEPIFPICYGTSTKWDNQHLYRAQGYRMITNGNPMNKVGDTIKITARQQLSNGKEMTWVIHSYIMNRTLKVVNDNYIEDTYEANNAPYNGNNQQLGRENYKATAEAFRTRRELPIICYNNVFTDGTALFLESGEPEKTRLRCVKRMEKAEYDALAAAGGTRFDTLYFTFEE